MLVLILFLVFCIYMFFFFFVIYAMVLLEKFCSHVGYSHNHTCMLSHVHTHRHKSAHSYMCV